MLETTNDDRKTAIGHLVLPVLSLPLVSATAVDVQLKRRGRDGLTVSVLCLAGRRGAPCRRFRTPGRWKGRGRGRGDGGEEGPPGAADGRRALKLPVSGRGRRRCQISSRFFF
ncbi:hypothetical protein GWI33_014612 [Rhynchophorus ferrugineus]|uniref:Uncharacterized protein n=1 Tax=Rhynchophorus ferrugineus TaxID=354439 RepID=A0A834I4R3_RHYFE|nr:hypothetical protein GWI33_014612 [Rhynchophorus ferrugineus]